MKIAILLIAFLAAFALPAVAQEPEPPSNTSFGFRVGYGASSGDWNRVRFAPDVRLLKAGVVVNADITLALSRSVGLVLDGTFERLDGSDWEAYAASRGDAVRVSASFVSLSVLLRPYLGSTRPNLVWIEFGPSAMFASGDETFDGSVYKYDFLSSAKFGGAAGIGCYRMIGDNTALTLKASALVYPTGVAYADGETLTMVVFPFSAGVRLFF